jgi:polysaccharide biosynthesis/export protein
VTNPTSPLPQRAVMQARPWLAFASVLALGLASCAGLPNAGPTTSQVLEQATAEPRAPFDLVEIDSRWDAVPLAPPRPSLRGAFRGDEKPPGQVVGVGDVVAVTIWQTPVPGALETVPGSGRGSQIPGAPTATTPGQIILPDQVVGPDGGITIPFGGRVKAAGRTAFQIEQSIERALAERLTEPQVLVTVPRSTFQTVTVSGESIAGSRVPLSGGGERLLDVLAAAGGVKTPPYETQIYLRRRGQVGFLPMSRLVNDPAEDIYVWPGDRITVVRSVQTFTVFGATQNNSQLPFGAEDLNLAQAIARAGGLLDARADPSGVFLFRFEQPEVLRAVGITSPLRTTKGLVPVLYHLNLKQVDGYFLAARFPMKNEDIIYVAGASTNALQKFFNLVGAVSAPVLSGAVIAR